MSQPQSFNWKEYLPYIIAGPVGLILLKTFTYTDVHKDFIHKARITESVQLKTNLEDGQLNLVIDNNSDSVIKNLAIDCNFISESAVSLKKDEYRLYSVFNRKSIRDFKKIEIGEIPSQTKKVECLLSDFDIPSKNEEIQKLWDSLESKK